MMKLIIYLFSVWLLFDLNSFREVFLAHSFAQHYRHSLQWMIDRHTCAEYSNEAAVVLLQFNAWPQIIKNQKKWWCPPFPLFDCLMCRKRHFFFSATILVLKCVFVCNVHRNVQKRNENKIPENKLNEKNFWGLRLTKNRDNLKVNQ